MENQIEINYIEIEENKEYNQTIKEVLTECLKEEQLDHTPLTINVILTNLETIKKTNQEYRKINQSTDVLSFPMFEKEELKELIKQKNTMLPDALGDIMICIPKVGEQAKEYGHSFQRELSYMLVHGFYHLMGYDHIEEEDRKVMRPKEELILNRLQIQR